MTRGKIWKEEKKEVDKLQIKKKNTIAFEHCRSVLVSFPCPKLVNVQELTWVVDILSSKTQSIFFDQGIIINFNLIAKTDSEKQEGKKKSYTSHDCQNNRTSAFPKVRLLSILAPHSAKEIRGILHTCNYKDRLFFVTLPISYNLMATHLYLMPWNTFEVIFLRKKTFWFFN